jgi:hypothetical protein
MGLRQRVLDFGTADHYELLHGGHAFPVAVATKDERGDFQHRVYRHDEALPMLLNLADCDDLNTYLSQSGFAEAGGRRTIGQVRALTSLWVDLDYYKLASIGWLTPEDLLDATMSRWPWLPLPTLLVESGRGAYFTWVFDKPLSVDRLHEWQLAEDSLVSLLAPVGADAAARDAARILRVTGSFHVVAGERVQAQLIGQPVAFDAMRQLLAKHAGDLLDARREATRSRSPLRVIDGGEGQPKRRHAGHKALSAYKLAQARMSDYKTLAQLRGQPLLKSYRRRLLYCYAQAAAWFCGSVQQLEAEIDDFADRYFAGGESYRSSQVRTVINRFMDDNEGQLVRLNPENEGRYRFGNPYILRTLEVTAAEQRQLQTLISGDEKRRRLTDRRRASGMMSREQYRDRAAQRAIEARRLRSEGLSVREVAERLGVTERAARGYLRG